MRSVVPDTDKRIEINETQEKYGRFASKYASKGPHDDPLVKKEKAKIVPAYQMNTVRSRGPIGLAS